jgi:hypothetical protein
MTDLLSGQGRLELFPLVHQITHFPHERLMLVDNGLRGGPILVETGGRHRELDVADGLLALGDPGLEIVDAQPASMLNLLQPPGFGVGAFLHFSHLAGRLLRRVALTFPAFKLAWNFLTLNFAFYF